MSIQWVAAASKINYKKKTCFTPIPKKKEHARSIAIPCYPHLSETANTVVPHDFHSNLSSNQLFLVLALK
jgi:hypothetical protein